MNVIFIVGEAGTGKSLLTKALYDSLTDDGWKVGCINLDPLAEGVTYPTIADVKDIIKGDEIIRRYGLGVNGGMIFLMDFLSTALDALTALYDPANYSYILVDTPGQLEIFSFRESGPYLIRSIPGENKAAIFLSDVFLLSKPENFLLHEVISSMLRIRLRIPVLQVVNKLDLDSEPSRIITGWFRMSRDELLKSAGDTEGARYLVDSFALARKLGLVEQPIFISAKTGENMEVLKGYIARIMMGGEDTNV